ncbi:MAG: heavy metal-binding domain-containing protein [Saprospiraceae bacterium]
MKKAILLSAVSMTLIFGTCKSSSDKNVTDNNGAQTFSLDTTKLKGGTTFYECPMNPEVISDKPGQCPKCGMDLSEMRKH